ncbi:MAG: hypothetical protein ACE5FM_02725 [Methyloligellaceae bacterium]
MISAVQSALAGLHTATVRLNEAAADIAQATAQSSLSTPVSGSPGNSTVNAPFTPPPLGQEPFSLTASLVDFKEAEILFKASAKLLGALGRLQGELLDIKS